MSILAMMLHDSASTEVLAPAEPIVLSDSDKRILRKLAEELAVIAALPVHKEKAELWRRLNDRQSVRPMVWINEVPWHEMDVNGELTLQAEHPFAREQEGSLRRALYQWRHFPGDMIISDFLACPLVVHSTGFGITDDVDIVRTDAANDIVSRHFYRQIHDFPDLEKIKMPVVTHHRRATEVRDRTMCDLYGDILPVRKVGQSHIWFTPWDYLIRWWGIEDAMIDMIDRPDLVHAAVERMVDAWMTELDQFVALNALTLDGNNTRIGSGGYGYVSELPGSDFDPDYVKPHNMWGCSNAQIFSEVSPEMQWEFAIQHDLRWQQRWGLNYYGCCEPLDGKADVLRRIPNLRKVSVTPWCKTERAVETIGPHWVMSRKPNPAILAEDDWSPKRARHDLRDFLEKARGCHVELIMKDISTVRHQPQRLWEWAQIASEEAEAFMKK
ncbi:MAG TPA: hypothetical protein VMP11_18325 [Verrucomicrobiae bacterium]|nr:hypothetical protein [Verrucomicrobiae bacterium]